MDTAAANGGAESKLDRIKRIAGERTGAGPARDPAGPPPADDLTPRQRRVLDAAHELARPGEKVSPAAIGERLGLARSHVSPAIGALRGLGLWPFARAASTGAAAAPARPPRRRPPAAAAAPAALEGARRRRRRPRPARRAPIPSWPRWRPC